MKLLFTICGRAGSKGLKNKNLKDFLGYPLAFYTVSAIDLFKNQNPDVECDIVLNTDSPELIDLFDKYLRMKIDIIKREPKLSGDQVPKSAVVRNCMQIMEERKGICYDMVVDLDITSPIRTVKDIIHLIDKKSNSDADVVFSVTDSRRNPYFNMVMKTDRGYERVINSSFNSRQEAPEIFDMNASLYAYSPSFLESGKGIFEGKCDVIRMTDTGILDIDCENDFELMQIIAAYMIDKDPELDSIRKNIAELMNKITKNDRSLLIY